MQMRGGDGMFDFGLVTFKVPLWAIKEKILSRQLNIHVWNLEGEA